MHIRELLHKTFQDKLPQVHQMRLKSLVTACEASLNGNTLCLTNLGRSINNTNTESSNIQKVDRLLGNGHLQAERDSFYQIMVSHLIEEGTQPLIFIDWTCINPVTNLYALRASLSMPGRSIVVYEKCYPKKKENNHATHKIFLDKLKSLLPRTVKPIIVTDAGFRGIWFAYILKLGWDFVGRLRNKNAVRLDTATDWQLSATFFQQATSIPTYTGHGLLTQDGKVPAHFVLYKGPSKGRKSMTLNKKNKRRNKKNKVHSKSNKEPWLLVTSLTQAQSKPFRIIHIYRQRMRIEENIRDTKCPHYGLGLKNSLTKCPQRMDILLLIAAMVTFIAWLAGVYTRLIGNAASFQAHSAKFTSSLSYVFLGKRVLKKGLVITELIFRKMLSLLYELCIQSHKEILQNG